MRCSNYGKNQCGRYLSVKMSAPILPRLEDYNFPRRLAPPVLEQLGSTKSKAYIVSCLFSVYSPSVSIPPFLQAGYRMSCCDNIEMHQNTAAFSVPSLRTISFTILLNPRCKKIAK